MKSLNIVNTDIEVMKKHDSHYIIVIDDELEIIKQDLEVLEILRKNTRIQTYEFLSIKSIFMYLIFDSVEEDYEKIKQWLEEQDEN